MNIFEVVRDNVTAQDVAELYGLKFSRNGRAICPWHNDHKPDLAFYKNGTCYCHACHNGGDAVNLASQIHGESAFVAAKRLVKDFRLLDPTNEYYPKKRKKEKAVEFCKNEVIKAEHELIMATDALDNYNIGDSKELRRLVQDKKNAELWLRFKKYELEWAKEGWFIPEKLKENTEEPQALNPFTERWIELCNTVHKCEKELSVYKPETADDRFTGILKIMALANEELDYMFDTGTMYCGIEEWNNE